MQDCLTTAQVADVIEAAVEALYLYSEDEVAHAGTDYLFRLCLQKHPLVRTCCHGNQIFAAMQSATVGPEAYSEDDEQMTQELFQTVDGAAMLYLFVAQMVRDLDKNTAQMVRDVTERAKNKRVEAIAALLGLSAEEASELVAHESQGHNHSPTSGKESVRYLH